jgi:hypothetical protein
VVVEHGRTIELDLAFEQAIPKVREHPGAGFGTLTEIDVPATPQEKLGQDIESYTMGMASTECVRFASEVSRTDAGLKGWLHHLRMTDWSAVEVVVGAVLGAVSSRTRRGLGAVAAE